MKFFLVLVIIVQFLSAAKVEYKEWKEGQTFSAYLKTNSISSSFLETISKEDQKFLLEIRNRYKYYELKNGTGTLIQALIPISVEMQIHIYRKRQGSGYGFDIIPIEYKKREYFANIVIGSNPYTDTLKTVKEASVAKKIARVFRGDVDAKKLKKGDEISFFKLFRIYITLEYPGDLFGNIGLLDCFQSICIGIVLYNDIGKIFSLFIHYRDNIKTVSAALSFTVNMYLHLYRDRDQRLYQRTRTVLQFIILIFISYLQEEFLILFGDRFKEIR